MRPSSQDAWSFWVRLRIHLSGSFSKAQSPFRRASFLLSIISSVHGYIHGLLRLVVIAGNVSGRLGVGPNNMRLRVGQYPCLLIRSGLPGNWFWQTAASLVGSEMLSSLCWHCSTCFSFRLRSKPFPLQPRKKSDGTPMLANGRFSLAWHPITFCSRL